jgi:hypothetical protein
VTIAAKGKDVENTLRASACLRALSIHSLLGGVPRFIPQMSLAEEKSSGRIAMVLFLPWISPTFLNRFGDVFRQVNKICGQLRTIFP